MTLPASGPLSLSQVNVELGNPSTATISLNDANVRTLANVPSGAISMQNLLGKSFIQLLRQPANGVVTVVGPSSGYAGGAFFANGSIGIDLTRSGVLATAWLSPFNTTPSNNLDFFSQFEGRTICDQTAVIRPASDDIAFRYPGGPFTFVNGINIAAGSVTAWANLRTGPSNSVAVLNSVSNGAGTTNNAHVRFHLYNDIPGSGTSTFVGRIEIRRVGTTSPVLSLPINLTAQG